MKKNLFEESSLIHEIFKNESYLYPEFLPERLPHREKEIDSLVFAFKPAINGKKPVNVAVFGSTGTGKTCTVRFVLKELEDYTDRAKSIYINCFEYSTRNSVLSAITSFLGRAIPRRGLGTDEIYSVFLESLEKIDFIPLIVLDEFDQLLKSEDGSKILYDLLRVFQFKKARVGLIIISNDLNMNFNLDERVKSSFTEERILFEPYSPQQLKDILRERVEYAFQENVLEKEVINVAAAHAAKLGGDCRIAIESLLKAGRLAEKENSEKVSLQHLRKAFEVIDFIPAKKFLKHLSDSEKLLLKILSQEFKPISAGELYMKFNKLSKQQLTERRLRDLISRLNTLNLVSADLNENLRGKTRMISLKISKELVLNELRD